MTDDFRLFCGDLGNEVNDDVLAKAFSKYPSFNMARVSITSSTQCSLSLSVLKY
jgi:RNA recognition motif-containing protein